MIGCAGNEEEEEGGKKMEIVPNREKPSTEMGYWGLMVSCLGIGIPIEGRGFGA
jgi:hypothetical protein